MHKYFTNVAAAAASANVSGEISFSQASPDAATTVTFNVTGLSPGLHGFHIHEFADFSNGCVSAGPHYNPHGKTHGGPDDEIRHAGDLGNILADAAGVAAGSIEAPLIHL